MKQRLKHLLVRLLSLLPGKPVILLESAPPLGDNTGALYRTLLAQGWNDRYRLVWVVPDPAAFRNVHEKNVSFAGTQGKWALLRLFWLRARYAHRRALRLRQGAGPVRCGLCHRRHFDDPYSVYQRRGHAR